ncbi:MAG: TIGR01777 family oxidoreductase [Planctomycetaceae bacterium]
MRILVSGSTGLVGSALIPSLVGQGHEVIRLVRAKSGSPSKEMATWDPDTGKIDLSGVTPIDAVVHLAGESIASGRWNAAKKVRIRDSRVLGTQTLVQALRALSQPPSVFVGASAIGYYGDRDAETLTEQSSLGTSFLADVVRDWERASQPLSLAGTRTVLLRFGVILSKQGGALQKMLTPFKLGAGGILGSGNQYMSCISLRDVVRAVEFSLTNPAASGPLNTVCPQPVTNREFTKTLGKVLGRPTIFPMPAFAARLAFGEMADALLLSSSRVGPEGLTKAGFEFLDPTLEASLRSALA